MDVRQKLDVQAVAVEDLHPAAWNPKFIRRDRLDNLKASIEADPQMLWRRPILATEDGTIYAGNQRYRACVELGWKMVPAILTPVPEELARQRLLRDNRQWGEWSDEQLQALIRELADSDAESVGSIGFTEQELAMVLAQSAPVGTQQPADSQEDVRRALEVAHVEDATDGEEDEARTSSPEADQTWTEGTIRQIVLGYSAEQFATVVAQLEVLREARNIDNNTDLLATLVKEFHQKEVAGVQEETW